MTTAPSQFNPIFAQNSFDQLITTFDKHNHNRGFDLSARAITHVQQYQLVALLNLRAQAFGMRGNFEEAVKDAKEIIKYAPERSIGYLRLGNLLHMQGKQSAAITLYDEALAKISNQDEGYQQLIQDKKKAEEKHKQHVDMITMLPSELVDAIFEYLPETTKVIACMDVSKPWRKRIVQSQTIWRTIWSHFGEMDNKSAPLLIRAIPHIAHHVKDLTIDRSDMEIEQMYLDYMEKGYFKRIKNLTLTNQAFFGICCMNTMMSFTDALWRTSTTLTKLSLTYHAVYEVKIHLSEILFYCRNLQTLVLHADCWMDWFFGYKEYNGEYHNTLVSMEIVAPYTTGEGIRPLLQYCSKLQRLYLQRCESDVVDVVNELSNENLEIFAFNPRVQVTSLEEIDREFYDGPPGLREIYYYDGGYGTSAGSFLKLLRKNQASLQIVYADMSFPLGLDVSEELRSDSVRMYEQWYFERLQHLSYWRGTRDVTETMLLRSIESCTASSFIYFAAAETPNLPMIINTLIKLPPVEELILSRIDYNDGDNDQRSLAMIQLFKFYAALPPLKQTFHTIVLHYCTFIADDVLDNLTQIATLKTVNFSGTCTVPAKESFRYFLQKMSHRLVEANLTDIDHVDDDVLNLLCEMEHLETVKLEKITEITEEGIKYLVDNTKALRNLNIENCITLSDDTVSYITKKINKVQISTNFWT